MGVNPPDVHLLRDNSLARTALTKKWVAEMTTLVLGGEYERRWQKPLPISLDVHSIVGLANVYMPKCIDLSA